jgi:hypothetical protein
MIYAQADAVHEADVLHEENVVHESCVHTERKTEKKERKEDAGSTVLIASENVLAAWSSRATTPTDLLALADADAQGALAVIERRRPRIVVLEQMFAASPRGAALVKALRSNSHLAGLDIRVLPADRSAQLGASGPINGQALTRMARSLEATPKRRVHRITMPEGAAVLVDGVRADLIDLSTLGAQIVSPTILRPNQKILVVMDREGVVLRTQAAIAWSSLELTPKALTYRAGVEFVYAQPKLLSIVPQPTGR